MPARGERGIYRAWKAYLKRVHEARRNGDVCPECGHLAHAAWQCNGGRLPSRGRVTVTPTARATARTRRTTMPECSCEWRSEAGALQRSSIASSDVPAESRGSGDPHLGDAMSRCQAGKSRRPRRCSRSRARTAPRSPALADLESITAISGVVKFRGGEVFVHAAGGGRCRCGREHCLMRREPLAAESMLAEPRVQFGLVLGPRIVPGCAGRRRSPPGGRGDAEAGRAEMPTDRTRLRQPDEVDELLGHRQSKRVGEVAPAARDAARSSSIFGRSSGFTAAASRSRSSRPASMVRLAAVEGHVAADQV